MIKQFEQFMNEQNNHNGKEIISFIEKLSMIKTDIRNSFMKKCFLMQKLSNAHLFITS